MPCTTAVPSGPSRSSTRAIGRRSPSRSAPPSPAPGSFGCWTSSCGSMAARRGCASTMARNSSPKPSSGGVQPSGISLGYIQPGKPDQNAFTERFNRTFREEVLDAYLFGSLEDVRAITNAWLDSYNTERPHESLGQVPPLTFLPKPDAPAESTFVVST